MLGFLKWFFNKIAVSATILIGITFLSFLLTCFCPSDAAEILLESKGNPYTQEYLETVREDMGLNDPMLTQYLRWMKNALRGDMGISLQDGQPVLQQLFKYLPNTLLLTFVSLAITVVISTVVGIYCATHTNRIGDYIIRVLSYINSALPSFFLALAMLYIFAVKLRWFKVSATPDFKGMVLPVALLVFGGASSYIRQIRAIVLEQLSQDYVSGCYARGMKKSWVFYRHVLKNSLIPIITLVGMSFGGMLGGSSIIETIFNWKGVGLYALSSIKALDIPVIQAYVVWMAIIFLSVNVIVDTLCAALNPKVRRAQKGS